MQMTKLVALAATLMLSVPAAAQTTPDATLDRVESRLDRIERREPPPSRAGPRAEDVFPWELSFTLPFTWNSNVANASDNPDRAFHADPTLTLGKKWAIGGGTQLFVEGSVDSDAYTEHHENDSSTLSAQAGIRFGDASKRLAPYIHYTVLGLYAGQFEMHDVTVHHFTVGAKRSWKAGEHGRVIADVSALRREATLRAVEQTRGTLSLTYVGDLDEKTSWSLGARGQYAHYTGGAASGRDDKTLRIAGGLTYLLKDNVALDLSASFQRNWSDRAGKDYSVWDIGPSLTLSTSF